MYAPPLNMAHLLPLVLLAPATFAQMASLDSIGAPIKTPTAEHQSQMKSLLAEAANHVRHGGPEEEKLHRVRELVELHNGFVTDMITEYRPSLMARYAEKVARVTSLFEPAADGRRLATGSCFDSYGAEWGCVLTSCWCDRSFDDSTQGPDISTGCDDSSEYSAYACDVSMLQTECKVENDADCVGATQDDWVMNFFTNGTSSSIVANEEVILAESGTPTDDDDFNLGCGGRKGADTTEEWGSTTGTTANSWSVMCCNDVTCSYTDETCSTDPYMCGAFKPNLFETGGDDDDWDDDYDAMTGPTPTPTFAPTFGDCPTSYLGSGTNYQDNYDQAMKGAYVNADEYSTAFGVAACPIFDYDGCTDCDLSSSPRNAAIALGSSLLVLAASVGLFA